MIEHDLGLKLNLMTAVVHLCLVITHYKTY